MSYQYDNYLIEHRGNVAKAFQWIKENIPHIIDDGENYEWPVCFNHDQSKDEEDEYKAYDNYFYGNKSYAVVQEFNKAWLKHIHRNPHHWQHWILIEDDGKENILIEMPKLYVIEMICDWWSFGWKTGNLSELFSWYDEHKKTMQLHPSTKQLVKSILKDIKIKLEEKDEK